MENIVSFQDAINRVVSTGLCVIMECLNYDDAVSGIDPKDCRIERRGETLIYIWPK